MQATRERILNILKERGQATVKELSETLGLTTVTIRHHLDTLRGKSLVAAPRVRHRKAPGRPQHVYMLTSEASDFFPKRYERLLSLLLEEMASRFSSDEVEDIMTCIGRHMAAQVAFPRGADFEERLAITTEYLDGQGYMTRWERQDDGGYLLHIANCPYEGVARRHPEVCTIDLAFLVHLLDISLRRIDRPTQQHHWCTYLVHPPAGGSV